jgi:2,5-furandicarboxylate decarboxylase 1
VSLRDFLEQIEKSKQLIHLKDKISRRFETSYVIRSFDLNGPVLMFENIEGFEGRVVANVCGTRERIVSAVNAGNCGLYRRLMEAWRSSVRPKIVEESEVEQVREKTVNLLKVPVLTHFEKDAGPYITSAIVHAKDQDGKIENVSVHRLQVLGKKHLAIRLVPRHLFKLWNTAKAAGKDLDVAISVGVHPAVLLAASSPMPFGVNEFDVANSLLDNRLRLINCKHVDACAPAESEFVLEGKISVTKEIPEGPFVDVTGTYDVQRMQPIIEIVGVVHRRDYIYQALLPSSVEHQLLMGLPHETLIWEAVSKVVPSVGCVNLTVGGCGWLTAVISVEKQVEGDGKNALFAAFAAHPSLKHAVIVDLDIDVFSPNEVEWAIATRFQASEDLVVVPNVRGSTLDSSANQETGLTSKMGIDATRPFSKPKEKFERAKICVDKRIAKIAEKMIGCV